MFITTNTAIFVNHADAESFLKAFAKVNPKYATEPGNGKRLTLRIGRSKKTNLYCIEIRLNQKTQSCLTRDDRKNTPTNIIEIGF